MIHVCQDEIYAALAIFGSFSGVRYLWWKIRGKCGKPCQEIAGHEHPETCENLSTAPKAAQTNL